MNLRYLPNLFALMIAHTCCPVPYKALRAKWFWVLLIPAMMLCASCEDEQISQPNGGVPFISGIEPASGRIGNTISIKGGNFSKVPQENQVFFNGIRAEVTVGIDEEMLVKVPAGATTGQVSVAVPGFETVAGPVFTIEKFITPTLYWIGGTVNKTTFDEEGQAETEVLYTFEADKSVLSIQSFELDVEASTIYFAEYEYSRGSFIETINYETSVLDTLYDKTSDPLCESLTISHLALDLENETLYAAASRVVAGAIRYSILKGSLDGSMPLEILYETDGLAWDISLAIGSDYLYWTDGPGKKVLRSPLLSFTPETIYDASDGLLYPRQIVVDETRNAVFFTDDPEARDGVVIDRLVAGSIDGNSPPVTLLTGEDQNVWNPTMGLSLDVENNVLYWITQVRNQTQSERFMRADLSQEVIRPDVLFEVGLDPNSPFFTTPLYFAVSFEETDPGGRVAGNGRVNMRSR